MLRTFSLVAALVLNSPVLATQPQGTTEKGTPLDAISLNQASPVSEPRLICKGCNENENRTLAFLQDQGITDKNALATIMGNIRQESMFISNICEGGARVRYHDCRVGGYGLIQFTSIDRYNGLGHHARKTGGDPSSFETQLSYMITEPQWKSIEPYLKTPGRSIESYMNHAYTWLGWGIHGARTSYAYEYSRMLNKGES